MNIVVICYNALPYTKATLFSLFNTTKLPYFLTIIDNGSNDGTKEYLQQLKTPKYCKEYIFIDNKENMGVGYAYNQGFNVSVEKDCEYTCFCNNDLYFQKKWLVKLKKYLNKNPDVALLNPLRPAERTRFDNNTSTMKKLKSINETDDWRKELKEYSGYSHQKFDQFCKFIIKNNRYKHDLEILRFPDSLSTCVCLARNSVIKEIGHFADPIFPKYGGEDIDLCWSIMENGYKCAILHNVYVHHFRGKSIKINKMNRQMMLRKSNEILLSKWKNKIMEFLSKQRQSGVDIKNKLKENRGDNYWLLSELNESTKFLER
jgi:GT2 family glycosyltransferase